MDGWNFWTGTALDAPSIMCVMRGRMERMPQEHRAERANGARFIRPCITHVIDATATWHQSTDNAQLTPPPSIHIFSVVRGRGLTAGSYSKLRPRKALNPKREHARLTINIKRVRLGRDAQSRARLGNAREKLSSPSHLNGWLPGNELYLQP